MLKEVQALRRAIHYSSLSIMLISITLMVAVIALATIIILTLRLEEPDTAPDTTQPTTESCPKKQQPQQSS